MAPTRFASQLRPPLRRVRLSRAARCRAFGEELKVRWTVLSCDYNGWNDAPEDEREWLDQFRESPSELTGDPGLQFTWMEKTSWPLPDWST
jgi:hypothetical protein